MSSARTRRWNEAAGAGWPRLVAAGIGVWFCLSAFLWVHGPSQMANAIVCGLLAIIFAMAASFEPRARYLNSALGVWILFSALALGGRPATLWAAILTGPALVAVSLVPGRPVTS